MTLNVKLYQEIFTCTQENYIYSLNLQNKKSTMVKSIY